MIWHSDVVGDTLRQLHLLNDGLMLSAGKVHFASRFQRRNASSISLARCGFLLDWMPAGRSAMERLQVRDSKRPLLRIRRAFDGTIDLIAPDRLNG